PWEATLKPIDGVIDPQPLLSDRLLELGRWISRYYCCPLGHTLKAMVPGGVRRQAGGKIVRVARLLSDDATGLTKKQAAALAALAGGAGGGGVDDPRRHSGWGRGVIGALGDKGRIAIESRHDDIAPNLPEADQAEPTFALDEDQRNAIGKLL